MSSPVQLRKAIDGLNSILMDVKDLADDDVVQLDETRHKITKNTNDRIHPFFGYRSKAKQDVNNSVREVFMEKLEKCFEGNPEGLAKIKAMKEMKMDDYGKGRPLSARRIRAVVSLVANETGAVFRQDGVLVYDPENQVPEVKESEMKPMDFARRTCDKYIELLKNLRDRQLHAINAAGFFKFYDLDDWIGKSLREHYETAIEIAEGIRTRGNADEFKKYFGLDDEAFENLQEPLSEDALEAKIFNVTKRMLSKTLCSFALLSKDDLSKDEKAREKLSEDLAKQLEDVFDLSGFDDFAKKLGRVKALVRPEGAKEICVRSIYVGNPSGENDDESVENEGFLECVKSETFKSKLVSHMKGDKDFAADEIRDEIEGYLNLKSGTKPATVDQKL